LPLVRDETVIEEVTPEGQDRLTERYTEAAVSFIAEHRERPFFLYFPHTAVHTPLHPGAAFKGKSGNGAFGDWVEEVDWSVGRILDALRQHKLAERTLVIFSSDNGPWLTQGANGGVAGPLRGGKGGTYEGGMREPTLAWWPGHVPAGSVCDAPAANFDLLPTFVGLAGGAVPPGRKIDGRDIAPLLLGKSKESPHEAIYYFSGPQLQAVRSGPWKLAVARQNEARARQEAAAAKPAPWTPTLYNLDDDIGERNNVYDKHPEVVKKLQGLIDAMAADLGAAEDGPGVRPPGRVEKPVGLYLPGRAPPPEETAGPRPVGDLKPGDALDSEQAPQIADRPFRVEAEFEPAAAGGVVVAHGGITYGYALFVRDGRCQFAVRDGGEVMAIASDPLPPGRVRAVAELQRDGTMMLTLNEKSAARGKAQGLISRQPAEAFCCGFDSQNPVADYGGGGRFAGTLFRLVVEPQ
jgi:hypothetical protein